MAEQYDGNKYVNESVYGVEEDSGKDITEKVSSSGLKIEEEVEMDNKRFYCYECKFLFSRRSSLDKHMENHSIFLCFKCEYTTCVEEDFKNHEQSHIRNKLLNCPMCNFSFTTSAKISLANQVCTHIIPFSCKVCGKGFIHESYMNFHFINHHRKGIDIKPVSEPFSCTVCDFKCSSDIVLQDHIDGHNNNMPSSFIGQLSSIDCNSECIQKSHVVTHAEKKRFKSSEDAQSIFAECKKTDFNNNGSEREYKTTDFNNNGSEHEYKTNRPCNLKMLKKQHVGKKLMACPECDFKTKYKMPLVNHIKTHKENMKRKLVLTEN